MPFETTPFHYGFHKMTTMGSNNLCYLDITSETPLHRLLKMHFFLMPVGFNYNLLKKILTCTYIYQGIFSLIRCLASKEFSQTLFSNVERDLDNLRRFSLREFFLITQYHDGLLTKDLINYMGGDRTIKI